MPVTKRHTKPKALLGKADVARFCRALPGATENVQWGDDLVFKVGGKMFAVVGPWSAKAPSLSFKASDDSFAILTREPGIIPAPYMARAKWVQLEGLGALPAVDLRAYLTRAHDIIAAGLSRKARIELGIEEAALPKAALPKAAPRTAKRKR